MTCLKTELSTFCSYDDKKEMIAANYSSATMNTRTIDNATKEMVPQKND